jgi:hypothetical protein
LTLVTWGDLGGSDQRLTILADGAVVIRHWWNDSDDTYDPGDYYVAKVRRLNNTGLAFVRAQVAKVGLFNESQTRKIVHMPGCCGGGDAISYVSNGRTVTVQRAGLPAGSYAPSAAWNRFDALVANLREPDRWVPASSWDDAAWAPFHASSYCLAIVRDAAPSDSPRLQATDIVWPGGIRPFASFGESSFVSTTNRVGSVTAESAYALAASVAQRATEAGVAPDPPLGNTLAGGGQFTSPWIDDAVEGGSLMFTLEPRMPGASACS